MRFGLVVLALSIGCGAREPILANAPRPDPAVVAGAAAAVAGAATLADPKGAADRQAEKNVDTREAKGKPSGPSVPKDVLDRADAQKQKQKQAPKQVPVAEPEPEPAPESAPDVTGLRPPPGLPR